MAPQPKQTIAASLLSRAHSPTSTTRILTEKILTRPLHLKPTVSAPPSPRSLRRLARLQKSRQVRRRQKPAPLSAKTKRSLAIYDIPAEEQKYALYAPLHRMWVSYIQEVLGPVCVPVGVQAAAKLVSADFHGAEVEVVRSRCVGRVGVKGIVVRDSKFTFVVVTRGDKVKVVPKEHTVFRFEVPPPGHDVEAEAEEKGKREGEEEGINGGEDAKDLNKVKNLVFELHGEQFQHRAVDRASKKFKPHHLPDL